MISVDYESRGERSIPPKPDYLRFVFKRDDEGKIVRDDAGLRSISAVEHVAAREVIHTQHFEEAKQEPAEAVGVQEAEAAAPTEVILLEN